MADGNLFTTEPCPPGFDSREIVARAIEFRDPPRTPYSFYYHPNATDIITVFSDQLSVEKPPELGQTYVDNMIKGLQHWVDGADRGYLAWGIMDYRLTA